MLTSATAAGAVTLALMINGMPVQATYLQTDQDGCEAARRSAQEWRQTAGVHPVQTKVANWCVVGAVIAQQWVSEQWRTTSVAGKTAGWRIVMPLKAVVASDKDVIKQPWNLDVQDPGIATRIRYRQSLQSLDLHHRESQRASGSKEVMSSASTADDRPLKISRDRNGEVLISGRHPDGGSYSVLIDRGLGQ